MKNLPSLILLAGSALVCLVLVASTEVNSKEVNDETKIKAIKEHVEQIKRVLEKRDADPDKKTSTTTKKPKKGSSTTTHKPRKGGPGSTTTKSGSSSPPPKSGEATDEGRDADDSSTTTKKPSEYDASTTTNPNQLLEDSKSEMVREREFWTEAESSALDYMIAGIDSWARAFTNLKGRTQSETKLGEVLSKFDHVFNGLISPQRARRLKDNYLELRGSSGFPSGIKSGISAHGIGRLGHKRGLIKPSMLDQEIE